MARYLALELRCEDLSWGPALEDRLCHRSGFHLLYTSASKQELIINFNTFSCSNEKRGIKQCL